MNLNFDSAIEVRYNEPLYKHSSFKIGGEAKIAVFPKSKDEIISAIGTAKTAGFKYLVVGNASNLLFDDQGFDGVIIFTKGLTETVYIHKQDAVIIKAEAGKSLTELASEAGKKHSLAGLEFAYGIPGTLGGAVYMNAGAYGGQMSDIILETEYFDTVTEEIKTASKDEQKLSYRHSLFAEHPEYIILSSTLELKVGDPAVIFETMNKNMTARKEKQPLEYPSAGSTFKRPGDGLFAGKLIQDAGLKGFRVGGAEVSYKHAGFVINRENATSADVLQLIEHIKKTVHEKFDVMLDCEIIYIRS